jgi:hypothetical protein
MTPRFGLAGPRSPPSWRRSRAGPTPFQARWTSRRGSSRGFTYGEGISLVSSSTSVAWSGAGCQTATGYPVGGLRVHVEHMGAERTPHVPDCCVLHDVAAVCLLFCTQLASAFGHCTWIRWPSPASARRDRATGRAVAGQRDDDELADVEGPPGAFPERAGCRATVLRRPRRRYVPCRSDGLRTILRLPW